MELFKINKIEKRILEIKKILHDKDREHEMASGVAMTVYEGRLNAANKPLLRELDELETQRHFIRDRQLIIINIITIIVALIIAFVVPTLSLF